MTIKMLSRSSGYLGGEWEVSWPPVSDTFTCAVATLLDLRKLELQEYLEAIYSKSSLRY